MKMFFLQKNLLLVLFFTLVLLPSVWPLFQPGFFQSDDGDWMIIRFSAFHQSFRDGQIPVRFLGRLNQEYGYPVANFLYPGFMYLGEIFKLMGFGFVNSIKIILGLSLVLSSLFSYLWLRKFFDKTAAAVGSLVYLYFPYHLYDVYKRGSVGEVLALCVIPFIFWQIERKSLFWGSIGIALLILSHNSLAVLSLPVIVCYMLLDVCVLSKKKKQLRLYTSILFCGMGLVAFFWIPAVFELHYTIFSQIVIAKWQEYFADVSLIGYSTIAIFLFVLFLFISKRIDIRKHRLTLFFFIIGLVSFFFATSISTFLWQVLPVAFIQFPFRFLSVTIIATSFLAACVFSVLSNKEKVIVGFLLLILVVISVMPFIKPAIFTNKDDAYFATNVATTTVANEYMPIWVKEIPTFLSSEKVDILSGKGEIVNIVSTSKTIVFDTIIVRPSTISINTMYYPGWKVFVDNKQAAIQYHNQRGVMQIQVPSGRHSIKAIFGETPLRLTSDFVSLIICIGLIIYQIRRRFGYAKKDIS